MTAPTMKSAVTTNGAGIITPNDLSIYAGQLGAMNYNAAAGKVGVSRHRGSQVSVGDVVRQWLPLDNVARLPGTLTFTRDSAALQDANMPHAASLPITGGDSVNRLELVDDPDGFSRKVLHIYVKNTDTRDSYNTLRYEVAGLYQGGQSSLIPAQGEFPEGIEFTTVSEIRIATGLRSVTNSFEFAFNQKHFTQDVGVDFGVGITGGSSTVFRAGGPGNENNSTIRTTWTGNQTSPWRNDTTYRSDYTLVSDAVCNVTVDATWICVVERWCLSSYTNGTGYIEVYVRFGGPGQPFTKYYDSRTKYGGYVVNAMRHQPGYAYGGHDGVYLYNSDLATHAFAPAVTELWFAGSLTRRGICDVPETAGMLA